MAYTHQNIKIVEGNTFALVLPLVSRHYTLNGIPVDEDIDYTQLENVKVTIGTTEYAYTIEEAGVQVVDNGTLKQGTYNVVLTATYQGSLLRAAWFELVTIVAWNMQSDADQYLQGSPIVCEAAVVLAGALTDAELEALKEEYREKNAQLQQAIEDAEAAKAEWEQKAEQMEGVAQEATSQSILQGVENMQAEIDAISPDVMLGKQQLAAAITAKGVATQTTDPLAIMAGNVQSIQNINKVFNVSDISQGWLGMPGTLEMIAQYYDAQYPYAQAYILSQGASVTAITGCKRIVYSDGNNVLTVDNPSGSYTIGAYSDEVGIGFAILMFDTPVMQNAPISNNSQVFEFGCKDATIEFGGMTTSFIRMCRFDGCDITMQAGALSSSRICIFDIGNSDMTISGGNTFNYCTQLQSISLPNVVTISGGNTFYSCTQLQSISLPNVVTISGSSTFYNCTNLIDIELGAAIEESFTLATWNPTNVLADQAKKTQMLQNIREHIAANLPDRTGLSSFTVTFSAAVKAAILADQPTADAFTNKNWTIA